MSSDPKKPEFKVGDKKFYIPGYRAHQLICILCTIVEVEEAGDAGAYYWLDEPIGHSVHEEELLYQDEAAIELMCRYQDELMGDYDPKDNVLIPSATLEDFRKESIRFINSTRKNVGCDDADFSHLVEKRSWDDWFNPQMVFDKRNKGAIKGAAARYEGKTYWVEAPFRHNHVINKICEELDITSCHTREEGFVLQDGTFVNREEAAKIAVTSGQIEKTQWGIELYSEDLW